MQINFNDVYGNGPESFELIKTWEPKTGSVHTSDGTIIPNSSVITRSDDETPLGIVGRQYKTISNENFTEFVETYAEVTGGEIVAGGEFNKGAITWAQVDNGDYTVGNGDDPMKKFTVFKNSHDGSSPFVVGSNDFRVSCMNMLNMAFKKGNVRIKHTMSVDDRVVQARKIMTRMEEMHLEMNKVLNMFANTKMDERQMKEFINQYVFPVSKPEKLQTVSDLFGGNKNPYGGYIINLPSEASRADKMLVTAENKRQEKVERVLELAQSGMGSEYHKGDNAWALMNGITEFYDHESQIKVNGGDEIQKRLESNLWGNSSKAKNNAFETLQLVVAEAA